MHLVAVNSEVPLRLPTTFDHDLQPLSLCRTSAAAARIPLHVVRTRKWHRGGPSRIRSPNCFKGVPYLSAAGKIRNRHLPRMYIFTPIESSLSIRAVYIARHEACSSVSSEEQADRRTLEAISKSPDFHTNLQICMGDESARLLREGCILPLDLFAQRQGSSSLRSLLHRGRPWHRQCAFIHLRFVWLAG